MHKISRKCTNGNQLVPCQQIYGQTDMIKLTLALCSFANAPKKQQCDI